MIHSLFLGSEEIGPYPYEEAQSLQGLKLLLRASAGVFEVHEHAISWEFDSPFEAGCEDQIVMKNQLGSFILASRALEGCSGHLDLSAAPYPAGKLKIMLKSRAGGTRRARVILWADGERVTWESM